MTLPEDFKNRMTQMLGGEAKCLFESLEHGENVRAFRLNTNKISVDDFMKICPFEHRKIPFCEDGYFTEEQNPGSFAAHAAGMVYMQDPAAMSAVGAVEIQKGWKILDVCAAPGGKTAQLSAYTGENGLVVANEYDAKRCRVLVENVERMGCRNTSVLNLDVKYLRNVYGEFFDLAVVDAPCSGEGMFRKYDNAIEEWSIDNVLMCRDRQRYILENTAYCIRNGGILLYSTCTFSLEENEENIEWFLDRHPEFEIIPAQEKVRKCTSDGIAFPGCRHDMTLARRFYPHISLGEGQFFAVLRKKQEAEIAESAVKEVSYTTKGVYLSKSNSKIAASNHETETALSFLNQYSRLCPSEITDRKLILRGGKIYFASAGMPLPEFGVFMPGVCLGEARKGRLVPHHGLFSAYGNLFNLRVELKQSDLRVNGYLRGSEIKIEDEALKGWGALTVDGCALGGVKVSGGTCKNHYPKGLWMRG